MKRLVSSFIAFAAFGALTLGAAHAEKWGVDGAHAYAHFSIIHFGIAPNYGRFDTIGGSYDVEGGELKGLTIDIDAASINTGVKKRDDHLKGPDFFNVKQFPKLTFKSTKVEKKSDDTYAVTGDLTIHGVTKSVTAEVKKTGMGKDPWGNDRIGFTADLTIKRSDFGITHMAEGLSDEVKLMLSAEGIKGK
ncbi:MAG: polyisoprenoid-binding protein [Myxococcales bacterium]|nr:polyisoprenoid-binding protein [Myxococcales bacterium]MCB9539716.1 polyisoprenoid-binding protein [Myxococcales bacterium]